MTERVRLGGSAVPSTVPAGFFLEVRVLFPSRRSALRGAAPSAHLLVPAAWLGLPSLPLCWQGAGPGVRYTPQYDTQGSYDGLSQAH